MAKNAAESWRKKQIESKFVKQQKRKRWCRHLQRICGAKVLWEVIAFTGRFEPTLLSKTVEAEQTQHARHGPTKQERRRLRNEKTEAKSRLRQAERLGKPVSAYQKDLLVRFKSGELHRDLCLAVLRHGHGTMKAPDGTELPIGGSTVGASRLILHDHVAPDVQAFLKKVGGELA